MVTVMKTFFKVLISVLTVLCVLKGIQILFDLLYSKYGKRYIQAEEM